MDWNRVNVWTNTFYALIHSLQTSKEIHFGDLNKVNENILAAEKWILPECSYGSSLLDHPFGMDEIKFRRDPNKHFAEISAQIVKMLIQDLTVIMDEMMGECLAIKGCQPIRYPQSKIQKLATYIDKNKYGWACRGCLELVAVRNVLTHTDGKWNEDSIKIIKDFVNPLPKIGQPLVIGIPMLFRYRKAMRTLLNEAKK
jgi:hypothetical protein